MRVVLREKCLIDGQLWFYELFSVPVESDIPRTRTRMCAPGQRDLHPGFLLCLIGPFFDTDYRISNTFTQWKRRAWTKAKEGKT